MQGVRSLGTQQMSSSVTAPADPIATGSVPQEQRDDGIKQLPSKRSVPPASAEMPLQSGRSVPSEPDILSASINRNTTSKNSPTGKNSQNSRGASRQTEKLPTGGDQSQKGVANDSLQTFGTYSDDPSLGKGEVESSKLRAHNPKVDWLEHRIHNPEVGSSNLRAHNTTVESSKTLAFKTRAIKNSTTAQKTSDDSGERGIRTLSSADGTRGTKRSALYAVRSMEPESGATKAAPLRADWPDTTGMSEGLLRVCIENARNLAFPGYIRGAQSFRIAS